MLRAYWFDPENGIVRGRLSTDDGFTWPYQWKAYMVPELHSWKDVLMVEVDSAMPEDDFWAAGEQLRVAATRMLNAHPTLFGYTRMKEIPK